MTTAIAREVSSGMERCELTYLERVDIDLDLARQQHASYLQALQELGCQVVTLPEAPDLPDSVFVEDTAIVFPDIAIITRPGAASRRPETQPIADVLQQYRSLAIIEAPGTLDGGDVLRVGRRVFVGLSERSNLEAIKQLQQILSPYGFQVEAVPVHGCLHLKSAVTKVAEDTILINRDWVDIGSFTPFQRIEIDPNERFAANGLLVGETLIYPARFERTKARLVQHGIQVKTIDVSELEKAEGAVTCCSIIVE